MRQVKMIQVCLLLSVVHSSLATCHALQVLQPTYQDLMVRRYTSVGTHITVLTPTPRPIKVVATPAAILSSIYKFRTPVQRPPVVVLRPKVPGVPGLIPLQPSIVDPSSTVLNAHMVPRPAICNDLTFVCLNGKYRTADGSCNNLNGHPSWGMSGRPQVRLLPADYHDGRNQPRTRSVTGYPLPSPREVSQILHSGDSMQTESLHLTHFFTVWGQFLDHDITHTPMARDNDGSKLDCCNKPQLIPERDFYWTSVTLHGLQKRPSNNQNCFPITVNPVTDRFFKTNCMDFVRSKVFAPTQICVSPTREQGNTQTAFVDASQVYGPTLGDQIQLRSGVAGQLKSAPYDLLPANSSTMCTKRPNSGDYCFGSGDTRVNEHPMLSSVHVVFHRFHNLLATHLSALNPHWNDEKLFQEVRKFVGAVMQQVTYGEYLPLVLGDREMTRYNLRLGGAMPFVYDPYVNPNIINSFSTAAFRFGHSMVNGKNSYGYQKVDLRNMFFHPHFVQHQYGEGLVLLLNGLIRDLSQTRDRFMNKDLTDHLFQSKDGKSLDLASLNIQRGRDHGLPSYNEFRKLCGLPSLQEVIALGKYADVPFLNVYRNLNDVDLFTGGLIETPLQGGVVGPTFACLIAQQFHNLKFGDRFWFENVHHSGAFTNSQIQVIRKIGMADILCLTTEMTAVQTNPFATASMGNPVKQCVNVTPIDLSAWRDI